MKNLEDNVILRLSFEFALSIIEFSEILESKRKYVISQQIMKSGTSIGANIREAQNSESYSDFVHKMKIAAKEINETEYWLQLCKHSKTYPYFDELDEKLSHIAKILNKIITTSKTKIKNTQHYK